MTPDQNPDIRIGSGPDIRIGSDHGIQRTDGRTDERTKRTITARSNLTVVDASAGARVESELVKLGDVLAGGFMRERIRHPVVRSGERAEIPRHVRAAVWYRDKGRCEYCPADRTYEDDPLHLDHIIPWSAGGSDTTDNLRLLCSWHNEDRSNWIDHALPKRPATWWCINCYDEAADWIYSDGRAICPTHRLWGYWRDWDVTRCRVGRRYDKALELGDVPTWHQRSRVTTTEHIAYCAHCNLPAGTSVVL